MKKRAAVLLLIFLLSLEFLFCQENEPVATALKTNTPPKIDGILDEEIWQKAPSVSDFRQFEPNKGEPVSMKTVAKILYDDNYFYFAFICFDPEPEKMVLGTNRRDGLHGDDNALVGLDTFHDKRTAYYFRTNCLGGQHDGRTSENGRISDIKWDGIWKSAGSRTEDGWSAEIAIPLTTLKYKPGKNQTWGLKFSRYIPRRFEKSFWCMPLEDRYQKVSTYGTLVGLDLEASSQKLEIIPYIMSRGQEGDKTSFEGGVDASYAFSQFLSGHLAINPDFATIEADREQVNLTRFELNLPEKRNFFLEGASVYNQRIILFYSRRIADIYGGGKLYGKSGVYEYSALTAQTKEEENEGGSSANFSVIRVKRDILESSNIGFLAANRIVLGKNQGTFGVDTTINFTEAFIFYGQAAMSYGDDGSRDSAFYIMPSYDLSTFHAHIRYSYLGKQFGDNANAVGFIRDDNRHELDSSISKIFWLKSYGFERIGYSSSYNIYWGMDKTLRSWNVDQGLAFDFQNKFSLNLHHNQEYKLYEKEFRNQSSFLQIGYNTREYQSVSLSYEFGKNFDSDFTLIKGQLRKKITDSFSFEYNLQKLSLSPDPENQSTWIHIFRANQLFTRDLFLKFFYQINTSIDKHNIQAVFVYRFQPPFGLAQLVLQRGSIKFGEKGEGYTLFLKLAYVF